MQTLFEVARLLRRASQKRPESSGSTGEFSESERNKMRKVIEFPKPRHEELPHTDFLAYLTGETLLIASELQGRTIYDSDGQPIRAHELYEVTPNGVKRVA